MARPNFMEKTFTGGSKTTKFVKVFFLESFPLYSIRGNLMEVWPTAGQAPNVETSG